RCNASHQHLTFNTHHPISRAFWDVQARLRKGASQAINILTFNTHHPISKVFGAYMSDCGKVQRKPSTPNI
ncbi:hypothetical protein, partial [Prevotella jejuni]